MTSKAINKHSDGGGYTATEIYEPVMDLFSDTRTPGHEDTTIDWLHLINHNSSATTTKHQAKWSELQDYANATSITNLPDDAIELAADKNQNQSSTTATTTTASRESQMEKKSSPSTPHHHHHYYNLDVISGVREEIPDKDLLNDDIDISSNARMTSTSQQRNDSGNGPFDRIHHLFHK
jgi:hypothetical protein